jgi:DNA-binding NarL/FixJ family response regulator
MATVLLCTGEPVLAEGLVRILASRQGNSGEQLTLIGVAAGPEELEVEMERLRPDILLADLTSAITFEVLSGLNEFAREAKIVLWVHEISTELALQAMSLGIRGILRKTLPVDVLCRCLDRVADGELWFEKALTDSLMTARRYSLTRREGQLVSLLSQGLKNKEIATALDISEGTVKVYLSRLFQKLGVKDRFELALYGLKNLACGVPLDEAAKRHPQENAKGLRSGWQTPRAFFLEKPGPRSAAAARPVHSPSRY